MKKISLTRQVAIIANSSKEHRDAMTPMMIAELLEQCRNFKIEVADELKKHVRVNDWFKMLFTQIETKRFDNALKNLRRIDAELLSRRVIKMSDAACQRNTSRREKS